MLRLTPFTKTDWYAWAGAEPFQASGRHGSCEPMIGYLQITEEPFVAADAAVVIWDDAGVTLHMTGDGEALDDWCCFQGDKMNIPAVLEHLQPSMKHDELWAFIEQWADYVNGRDGDE